MNSDFYQKNKLLITFGFALLVLAHLIFEHFHGGVVTHYLLQDDSLPGLSNWLGLITLPIVVWVTLLRIDKRKGSSEHNERNGSVILYRFITSVLFGVLVSYLFSIESSFLDYMMLSLFVLSLFIPLYFGEFLVGFTVGTMYVFGANIPIIGGLVLLLILFVLYRLPRFVYRFVQSKIRR
tara:strand:+ start:606 stop:1145 length:540 start_codon:yes stop_codon:yes gene_type:complete